MVHSYKGNVMTSCNVGLIHYEIKKRYFPDNRTQGTVN
jgi:hypothetical protein